MTKRIAVFGGTFNPPGLHHRAIAIELSKHFDEVVIVPCGPRDDKPKTKDVEPIARATILAIATTLVEEAGPRLKTLNGSPDFSIASSMPSRQSST